MAQQKSTAERVRDNSKLRRVALLWWAQTIYELADKACRTTGAYEYCESGHSGNANEAYREVIAHLKTAAIALNGGTATGLTLSQALTHQSQSHKTSSGCSSDDDCPDDYICVEGHCESLFPG
jgi:hypothetical protein